MRRTHHHRILVVDDEVSIGKAIRRLLRPLPVETVCAENGIQALDTLKTSPEPFSLIISDQCMPGMPGTVFLEKAKEISPDTVRFLITGYSNMDTIIDAVNKGSIQRYIAKPWRVDELLDTIREGLGLYEHVLEKQKLISLAKEQSAKLYALNRELVEAAKTANKKLSDLDAQIRAMAQSLAGTGQTPELSPDRIMEEMAALLDGEAEHRQKDLNRLYTAAADGLREAFDDLALRNGLDLATVIPGGNHDGYA